MKTMTLLAVLLSSTHVLAQITYTTHDSKGNAIAVFKKVHLPGQFGDVWQDPSGTVWSSYQGQYYNVPQKIAGDGVTIIDSDATEACAAIGGVLPTVQDYIGLMKFFEISTHPDYGDPNSRVTLTDQGLNDFNAIFSDMDPDLSYPQNWYCTSSIGQVPTWVYLFGPIDGGLITDDHNVPGPFTGTRAVRCLRR